MTRLLNVLTLIIGFLIFGSCSSKKEDENIVVKYDKEGNVIGVNILSKDGEQQVQLEIDDEYKVTKLTTIDSILLQQQEIAFYGSGSIFWINNYIMIDTSLRNNQLYYFDLNQNIVDTSSFFAIIENRGDSSEVLYVTKYMNRNRMIWFVDSTTRDLGAYHPAKGEWLVSGAQNGRNLMFKPKDYCLLRFHAYSDSIESPYYDFTYFFTPSWRDEIKFVKKERPK